MNVIQAGRHRIEWGHKTLIMGILNVTPDSFSDGGQYVDHSSAIKQAEKLIHDGADLIDIGGESSRPGSHFISVHEEIKRILPVIKQLQLDFPEIPISVDTWKHEVAKEALAAGASLVNDITGLFADGKMAAVCRDHNAALIVMHNAVMYRLDHPATTAFQQAYRMDSDRAACLSALPLRQAILRQLEMSIVAARQAGLQNEQIIVDPGIGFGMTTQESLSTIQNLSDLTMFGLPVLIAPSRKRFIGDVLDLPVDQRQTGTAAAVAAGIAGGAAIARIHDVEWVRPVIRMSDAIYRTNLNGMNETDPQEGTDKNGFGALSDDFGRARITERQIGQQAPLHDTMTAVSAPDRILMQGMMFRGYTGVLDAEKTLGQEFRIDLALELYDNRSFTSDDLMDSVSYAEVYEQLGKIVRESRFNLIERLAGYIAEQLLDRFSRLFALEVTVGKPNAPIDGRFETMAVRIRRERPLL